MEVLVAENNKKENEKKERESIKAFLSLPSFLTIVTSSVEVFRKETIGYLVGIKGENKFMVEYAIPYQTAESTATHASIDENRVARVNEILNKLSEGLEYIGDFHSHTVYGECPGTVIPSNTDLLSTVPEELNIICAVNIKKKSVDWYENKRGILTGTVGEYRIEIGGYYVKEARVGRKYQRVLVKCPSVTGIHED
jgi:proteasome lid subunit RPN8/RPN11